MTEKVATVTNKEKLVKSTEGVFFCRVCLEDHPLVQQSPDPRYCRWACDYLLDEASRLTNSIKPKWVPRTIPVTESRRRKSINDKIRSLQKTANRENGKKKQNVATTTNTPERHRLHMKEGGTKLNEGNNTNDKITKAKSRGNFVPLKGVGRPKKILPERKIIRLIQSGKKSEREIAREYNVSHTTIQRILSGKRVLV